MKKLLGMTLLALATGFAACAPVETIEVELDDESGESEVQGKHRWRAHVVVYAGDTFEAVIENGVESRVIGEYETYGEAEDAARDAAKKANQLVPGCDPPAVC